MRGAGRLAAAIPLSMPILLGPKGVLEGYLKAAGLVDQLGQVVPRRVPLHCQEPPHFESRQVVDFFIAVLQLLRSKELLVVPSRPVDGGLDGEQVRVRGHVKIARFCDAPKGHKSHPPRLPRPVSLGNDNAPSWIGEINSKQIKLALLILIRMMRIPFVPTK